MANAYDLIDFASFRCDDHFVSGVEATVLNTGILVGGGSERRAARKGADQLGSLWGISTL